MNIISNDRSISYISNFNNVATSCKGSIQEVHVVHIEKEEKHTAKGDSDVSDSGLVSGIQESPKSSHTLPRKKSARSGSVVYQSIQREDKSPVIDPDVLQKASSDPCLVDTKTKKKNKSKVKHRKSGTKSSRRHHNNESLHNKQ